MTKCNSFDIPTTSQLPVGSPNSSCENVALYLSMGLTFIEQTVLWLKKKKKKEVIKRRLTITTPPPSNRFPVPSFLFNLSPLLSLPPLPPSR